MEGRRLNDVGHFTEAAMVLAEARAMVAGSVIPELKRILIRIDLTTALTDLDSYGYPAAAEMEEATRAARKLDAPDMVALTHIQHGVINARCGVWSAAAEQLRQAVALFAYIGPFEQCSTGLHSGWQTSR